MNKLGRGPPRRWNSAKEVFVLSGSNPRSLEAGQFLSVRPSVELTCNEQLDSFKHQHQVVLQWKIFLIPFLVFLWFKQRTQ